jgi:ABC-type glycerol-3-phosphate transport system substrate-binding protein
MRRQIGLYAVLGFLIAGSLVACAELSRLDSQSPAESPATIQVSPTALTAHSTLRDSAPDTRTASHSVGLAVANVAPRTQQTTPTPTSPGNVQIRVWWPDELYPRDGSTAEDVLRNQLSGFQLTYSAYSLDFRRKRANGLGGILPTLRTAEPVAPGALPDLTLMRYPDMVTAAREGLILPIEGWAPSDLIDVNLIPGIRALGEVDGVLYGVPYAINLYHSAYRATVFEEPLLTFSDVLAAKPHYLFPAGKIQGSMVNWTLLLQYMAAGGRLVDETGAPTLDEEPLQAVLAYYEQGVDQGIFSPALAEYTQYESYWNNFVSGDANLITLDSITYLTHKDSVANTGLAPIPTLAGAPISALDGWMWVLTTQDPDHQEQARAFLTWMMRVSQHSVFTEAFGILPSQQRALQLWDDEAYADFARQLIEVALLVPSGERANNAALALADSLLAVLNGVSADQAAGEALDSLGIE